MEECMKRTLLAIMAITCILMAPAFSCDERGQTGIVEDNDLWIGQDVKSASTIDEAAFNKIIDDIGKIYSPMVAKKGGKLTFIRNWSDGTVNAYASRKGNIFNVAMYGGLARHDAITPDGFALVVCHELGHHIGGIPKKRSFFGTTWASTEGQADYFGNLKCLRNYMEGDDNIKIIGLMKIPADVKTMCNKQFADANDSAICQRGSMAGLSLANLFASLRKFTQDKFPAFDKLDRKIVSKTNPNHPAPQCRLDTYFAGSICEIDKATDVSDKDEDAGVCSRKLGIKIGTRPFCWFKPKA